MAGGRTIVQHCDVFGENTVAGIPRGCFFAGYAPETGAVAAGFLARLVNIAGTLSRLAVRVIANGLTNPQEYRLHSGLFGSTPGSMVVTVNPGETSVDKFDLVNTDTIQAGQYYQFQANSPGSGSATYSMLHAIFQADGSETVQLIGCNASGNPVVTEDLQDLYIIPAGGRRVTLSIRERSEVVVPEDYSWGSTGIHIDFNERITDTTCRSYIDGAFGASTITLPPGLNNQSFYDLVNRDDVLQGQAITHRVDTGTGGGRMSFEKMASDLRRSDAIGCAFCAGPYDTVTSTPGHYPTAGMLKRGTIAEIEFTPGFPCELANLTGWISRTSGGADTTWRSIVNGLPGAGIVTVPGGVGSATDLVNADTLAADDNHCTEVSSNFNGGNRVQSVAYSVRDVEAVSAASSMGMLI